MHLNLLFSLIYNQGMNYYSWKKSTYFDTPYIS